MIDVLTRIVKLTLPIPHTIQRAIIVSTAKRIIVRAGRRGGKTFGLSILAVMVFFFKKKRVLYAAPTSEQTDRFWAIVCFMLMPLIACGYFKKSESERYIERVGTNQRLKAKTAWNADTLRGDFADLLILDEFQLMHESTWTEVGAPMLLDNDGKAVFIYTPPSLRTLARCKADNPRFCSAMFKRFKAQMEKGNPRYAVFSYASHLNPYISQAALSEIAEDMTDLTYRMEILAEDIDEAPSAFWKRKTIERNRTQESFEFVRIVVSLDPSATKTGNECGIIVAGKLQSGKGVCIADRSMQGSPMEWAKEAINVFKEFRADRIVAESNQGGEMVATVIHQIDPMIPVKLVWASRGKAVRAEPIAALSEQNQIAFNGSFPKLEDELCLWTPDSSESPNRLDAFVWAFHELMIKSAAIIFQKVWKEEYIFTDATMPVVIEQGYQRHYVAINYNMNLPKIILDIYDDGKLLWVRHEYSKTESNADTFINELKEFTHEKNDIEYVMTPESTQIEQALLMNGVCGDTPDEEQNTLTLGLGMLMSMFGKGKIRVHERCINLLSDINQYQWVMKDEKQVPALGDDRAITALRFAVMSKIDQWRVAE
jgi:hypothetical protein